MRFDKDEKDVFFRDYPNRDSEYDIASKLNKPDHERLIQKNIIAIYMCLMLPLGLFRNVFGMPLMMWALVLFPSVFIIAILTEYMYYADKKTNIMYVFACIATVCINALAFPLIISYQNGDLTLNKLLSIFVILLLVEGIGALVGKFLLDFLIRKSCIESKNAVCVGYIDTIRRQKNGQYAKTAVVCEFEYEREKYLVTDYIFYKDDSVLPSIGSSVNVDFNPDDPYTCIIDEHKVKTGAGVSIGATCLLFSAIMLFSFKGEKREIVAGGKVVLSPQFIHELTESESDYFICERRIKSISDHYIILEEYNGFDCYLNKSIYSGFEEGETVYYMCSMANYQTIFDKDQYVYEDDCPIQLRTRKNDEGKIVLTDEVIDLVMANEYWDIYEFTLQRIDGKVLYFDDELNRGYWLRLDDENYITEGNVEIGKDYYYVQTYTNYAKLYDTDLYYYEIVER